MSKDLDRELAEAIGPDDDDVGASEADEAMAIPQAAAASPKKSNVGLLAALLTMVVAIVGVFMFGFKEASVYSMKVSQFLAEQDKHAGKRVRIEGELVPGTLQKRDSPCEFRFTVMDQQAKDRRIAVRYPQCIVPDTFRDVPQGGVEVTAEGLMKADHFEASLIMAKCASKYDPETHTMGEGEAKPEPAM